MTDEERNRIADQLFALVFSLRPVESPEQGQAWVLEACSTAMARAILASVGPTGEATPIVDIAKERIAAIVETAQAQHMRSRLTVVPS